MNSIVQRINELRTKAGMSQNELAQKEKEEGRCLWRLIKSARNSMALTESFTETLQSEHRRFNQELIY